MVVIKNGTASLARLRQRPHWLPGEPSPALSHDDLQFLVALRTSGADLELAGHERAALLDQLAAYGLLAEGSQCEAVAQSQVAPVGVVLSEEALILQPVISLAIVAGGFETADHDGARRALFDAQEICAALSFASARTPKQAEREQKRRLGEHALPPRRFANLVRRLLDHQLLVRFDSDGVRGRSTRDEDLARSLRANEAFRQHAIARHRSHDLDQTTPRAKVVLVHASGTIPPLSLGMILSHARQFMNGALNETYDLYPRWVTEIDDAPAPSGSPTIYFFSDYLWSHDSNLAFSRQIKSADPDAVTVHGGPDCPSSVQETEAYLRQHPYIDVAVRGEGEGTAAEMLTALAPSVRAGRAELTALEGISGLTFRAHDQIVRGPDRARFDDVNIVPSPYLDGVFDVFGEHRLTATAIIETNRGCPYGCAFCDWGSATNSRVRKFESQRVFDELTWCAEHEVNSVFCADANFGIFPRDVEIARHVVTLKKRYGFPKRFVTNYAKNSVKHLKDIVMVLAEGGVLTEGLISLQSMDEGTLEAVRRDNIRLEKYEELAREFRQAKIPLFVDLMMGLPGQTLASLQSDLQQCVDREVNAKCHATEILVNSPMNDPAYREQYALEVSRPAGAGSAVDAEQNRAPAFVIASSTFSRDDYHEMHMMRRAYLLCENLGVMRHVLRFVRSETGRREVEVLEEMRAAATKSPDEWPYLALVLNAVPDVLAPPVSWAFYIDDLRRYLTAIVGVRSGPALETVLSVQLALLPSPSRSFPTELPLAHDYAAWHREVMAAKDAGRITDWETVVRPLGEFASSRITVADPNNLCQRVLGSGTALDPYSDWELQSPVSRAMPGHYQL